MLLVSSLATGFSRSSCFFPRGLNWCFFDDMKRSLKDDSPSLLFFTI